MHSENVKNLHIIEIPYGDLNWGPDLTGTRKGIYSDIQLWKKYRELDDFKLCGVYGKSNVPYDIEEINYHKTPGEEVYLTLTRQVSDAVYNGLKREAALLVTGGYCKDAVGVCGGIQRAIGADKQVGIVYLDAHSDMATLATTTTGILGGMPLAVVLGVDMDNWREAAGLVRPFNPDHVLLSDFRESSVNDDGALSLVQSLEIKWLETHQFEDGATWKAAVAALADKVDIIYLHVDADILNSKYAPNVACVAQGGPDVRVVMDNIRTVMETGKVLVYSSFGFYFDTDVPGQDALTLSGIRLIGAGLESWKEMPKLSSDNWIGK